MQYKRKVLGIDEPGTIYRGNQILSSDIYLPKSAAFDGLNFLDKDGYNYFHERRNAGWGIEPFHCLHNMASSQALTINLLALLRKQDFDLVSFFNMLLERDDIRGVTSLRLEYAPARRSIYLGDMTRIDLVAKVNTNHCSFFVAFEVKYSDRVSRRNVGIDTEKYRQTLKEYSLFLPNALSKNLATPNQFFRVHSLAAAMTKVELSGRFENPYLVVIAHDEDPEINDLVAEYSTGLIHPSRCRLIGYKGLSVALRSASMSSQSLEYVDKFIRRYV